MGGLPVVGAKAAAEGSIGGNALSALADEGGAGERGWIRGETEEDFAEDVMQEGNEKFHPLQLHTESYPLRKLNGHSLNNLEGWSVRYYKVVDTYI
jgi:hypothetical protein